MPAPASDTYTQQLRHDALLDGQAQQGEDLVEERHDLAQRAQRIQQAHDRAQQVAEQVAGTRDSRDVEVSRRSR